MFELVEEGGVDPSSRGVEIRNYRQFHCHYHNADCARSSRFPGTVANFVGRPSAKIFVSDFETDEVVVDVAIGEDLGFGCFSLELLPLEAAYGLASTWKISKLRIRKWKAAVISR